MRKLTKTSAKRAGLRAEIWTRDLQHTKLECKPLYREVHLGAFRSRQWTDVSRQIYALAWFSPKTEPWVPIECDGGYNDQRFAADGMSFSNTLSHTIEHTVCVWRTNCQTSSRWRGSLTVICPFTPLKAVTRFTLPSYLTPCPLHGQTQTPSAGTSIHSMHPNLHCFVHETNY